MELARNIRIVFFTYTICILSRMDKVAAALSACGETLHGSTGTFTSPNYPHSPKRRPEAAAVGTLHPGKEHDVITCEWRIIVPEGRGIQLNFGDFDMAAGLDECDKGELEVFTGVDENKRSLDKYCGGDELGTFPLTTNSATVIFRRPTEFSGKGFLVSYIATTPAETIDDFVTCVDRGSDHVGVGSYSVLCPGGCANITEMSVRGETDYRDDSYLCKAAVHAGVISDVFGGRINVQKVPGKILYMGSEANGVISEAGAMSDTMFEFRTDTNCQDKIKFHENQLRASSYWTRDPKDPENKKWKPDKAILDKQLASWSPNNPSTEQWLQVDLKKPMIITAISTRGSSAEYYTTTSYKIAYRNDTNSAWTFYREERVNHDKVFVGNRNIFKAARNNFIRPRVVGRFIRIYPTPVQREGDRYALQIALNGCDTEVSPDTDDIDNSREDPVEPAVVPVKESTTSVTTTPTTERTAVPNPKQIDGNKGNATTAKTTEKFLEVTGPGGVIIVKSSETPKGGDSTMNESGIIVIGIVAALAVTSILLAALVLILVRKRKKDPKGGPVTPHPMQQIPDNNNTRFHYNNKKSRKRSRKNTGEHFQNADYRDTLLQVAIPQNTMGIEGANLRVTLPAEQAHFLTAGSQQQNGTIPALLPNKVIPQHNSFHPADETDSFISDEEDHEYQVIDDDQVVRQTPVHSMGRGSSKASTGSSLGNNSRKSDTMQRSWGVDGNQWNSAHKVPSYPPNSPIFFVQERQMNGSITPPHTSSFSSNSPPTNGGFSYPHNSQLGRNHTFSGGEAPHNHSNLRRGNSQSPSQLQRNSSSSNSSSHSYHPNGTSPYPHDVNNPYYSSVPNGEGNPVSLKHAMYGGPAIPEQNEIPASATKRIPSYKVPRPFGGDLPALPDKVGKSHMQNENDPSIDPSRSTSPSARSDYDRLYRNNSSGGPTDNNFSVFNGSHSQYNQLKLNSANV